MATDGGEIIVFFTSLVWQELNRVFAAFATFFKLKIRPKLLQIWILERAHRN